MSYEQTTLKLHEWGIRYIPNYVMLNDIIQIYNEVTFGKEYFQRCPDSSSAADKQTSEGRSIINVKVNFNKKSDAYWIHNFTLLM